MKKKKKWGTHGVMVILIENGLREPSSNPGQS